MPEVTRKHNNNTTQNTPLYLKHVVRVVELMKLMTPTCKYHIHLNTISNGELSDPICNSINRGIILDRFRYQTPFSRSFILIFTVVIGAQLILKGEFPHLTEVHWRYLRRCCRLRLPL